tara:strand:- start:50363 stop:50668 length:306 start_codon:yes stop_codon:yes gene_type:complete
MNAMGDVAKVSDEDLEWIVGTQDTHETQAQSLMTKGRCFVIGTCGAARAVFFDAQGKAEVRADRATVVEAVGVGDTFNARVLARLTQDAQLIPHRLARMTA